MKFRTFMIFTLLLAMLILVTACASGVPATTTSAPASSSGLDGGALVQERCAACHNLSVVERTRFSAAQWKTVVDMMMSRGAQLNSDEEAAVVSWLAANYGK